MQKEGYPDDELKVSIKCLTLNILSLELYNILYIVDNRATVTQRMSTLNHRQQIEKHKELLPCDCLVALNCMN